MSKKYFYILITVVLFAIQVNGQINSGSRSVRRTGSNAGRETSNEEIEGDTKKKEDKKTSVPVRIKSWSVAESGAEIATNDIDTTLWFFHEYMPFFKISISNTFTGNNGGAYISNDFFKRTYNSDFFFAQSFDAYMLTPSQINYYNTTTPYTLLDYSQSENRIKYNETRFNVLHTQNINKDLNFALLYNSTRSQGHYLAQENKFSNIGIVTSYNTDKFISHANIIFNRVQTQENGGVDDGQNLNEANKSEQIGVRMDDAFNQLKNNNFYMVNEYRLGKTIVNDTSDVDTIDFIPRIGFMYEIEVSSNNKTFDKTNPANFFKNIFSDSTITADVVKYTRISNIFQIKIHEAPDRKYTFGKRAYIGFDQLWYNMSTESYYPKKNSDTYVGGSVFRNEGRFWQWKAEGRIYLTGYKSGQTELDGFVNKPIKIGKDTASLKIEGSLKSVVPDFFTSFFYSNHYKWLNYFDNINDMTVRSSINSKLYNATAGFNYSLIGNYIYNDTEARPTQAENELLVISAYLNKDFESKHWIIKAQMLIQKSSMESYLRLPLFAGFLSINYRTIISKVLHTQLGVDTRYHSSFYAEAYNPATSMFYIQNEQKVGNYPFINLHANLKLKRTRLFFMLMNAPYELIGDNYYTAPSYPLYRRTFRLGVAWSFYD